MKTKETYQSDPRLARPGTRSNYIVPAATDWYAARDSDCFERLCSALMMSKEGQDKKDLIKEIDQREKRYDNIKVWCLAMLNLDDADM